MKKLISVIFVLTLLFSVVIVPAHAENTTDKTTPMLENNYSVDSTNSFGGLLSQTINSEMEKQLENNGFNVFSIEYNDGEALVDLEVLQDCTLFVGIYSEDGTKLITSQNIEVTKDDTLVTLTFDTSVVPTYFIIQAYLINTADLKPLCKVYNSNMYTKEMQEFLSKTTDDFESDKVLQLDDDKTNNFAVFNDTVEIIENNIQMTVTADVENGIYIITNPTDEVKALQVGDIFSYNYDNGEVLILKIASISTDEDGAITYTEGELELEDVFDYVKIDSTAPTNSATVDTSELDDGIVYYGCIENPSTYALVDVEATKKFSHSYEFFDYKIVDSEGDEGSAKTTISGSLDLTLSGEFKVFITFNTSVVEIKFDYELKAAVELSASLKGCNILLGKVTIMPVTGIIVTVEPSFVLKCSGKISFSGSVYGTIGVKLDTETGIENLTSIPRAKTEVEAEATIFIGLSFEPSVKILHDKVAKASLDAVIGGEIKASRAKTLNTEDEHHSCSNCLEGEIYGKFEMEYTIRLLNKDKLEFKFKILEVKLKITDFYLSSDFDEFDFTKCPHKEYKLTVSVNNSNGKALKDITVNIGSKSDTTNTFGNASVFLPDGEYTIKIINDKYTPVSKSVTVNGKSQKIKIRLSFLQGVSGGGSNGYGDTWGDTVISIGDNKLSLGGYHSAVITEDGSLYIWGDNEYGQIGNGTTTDCLKPVKIMDNVVSVSLGYYHSAAVTKDGSLYTWGDNEYGQLGNNTTKNALIPIKILENVVSVNLGSMHSAAITKDGSLYTWGSGSNGKLGNGTTTNIYKPIKIMDNVDSVSLGSDHSAAITKDGKFYAWGDNSYGQLGDGTTTDCYRPKKTMDNVASVSLSIGYTAVITKDNSLYTWGSNHFAQLGNGTTSNSLRPIKIMSNVAIVSLGNTHSAAITNDGSLYTWGNNASGQLGNGTTTKAYRPQKIMNNVVSLSLGQFHGAAITNNGSLYIWGDNQEGQLGTGSNTRYTTPIKINLPQTSTYSLRNTTTNPNEFTDLIPNFIYNYYVMESEAVVNPLNSKNLKFVGQAASDENGVLTIPPYKATIASSGSAIVLKEFVRVSGELEYLISNEDTAIITGCTAKNAVAIPEKLGYYIPTAIANMAFENCYNLTDVTLANSITEIADSTFFAQENITLHSNCKNDNTYFESFADKQGIEFSVIHNFREPSLNEIPTDEKDGSITQVCADCKYNESVLLPSFNFKSALNIVNGKPVIIFKLPKNIFVDGEYENISISLNGEVVELNEGNDYYVSSMADSKNDDLMHTVGIVADVCGQCFEVNYSESISSIADVNSDAELDITDLVKMNNHIIANEECDINGDDSSNSADLALLRKLLLLKTN